jgi:thiamine-phosphate pyrophosphorylase
VHDFSQVLKEALGGGDVASFQLRLKHVSDDEIRRACDVLRPIVQAAGAAFLLNDRPDLAAELGCDGVHIGQEDAAYAEARAAVGKDAIVGVTCHNSRHLAMEAGEAGADYIAFGAFFPTATKEAKTQADIELLQWWAPVHGGSLRGDRRHHGEECAASDRCGRRFPGGSVGGLGI